MPLIQRLIFFITIHASNFTKVTLFLNRRFVINLMVKKIILNIN